MQKCQDHKYWSSRRNQSICNLGTSPWLHGPTCWPPWLSLATCLSRFEPRELGREGERREGGNLPKWSSLWPTFARALYLSLSPYLFFLYPFARWISNSMPAPKNRMNWEVGIAQHTILCEKVNRSVVQWVCSKPNQFWSRQDSNSHGKIRSPKIMVSRWSFFIFLLNWSAWPRPGSCLTRSAYLLTRQKRVTFC